MSSAVSSPVKVRRGKASIISVSVVRVIVFTICCAGLGMAFGLFGGILVQVARSLVHRGSAGDMTVAYRFVGIPLAAVCGVGALIVFTVLETRTARRLLAKK
ncbi:MAG TPA: hypothetical protein VGL89_14690 [Candidatus Koribacter sp.]|jgi:hypothetical protein